VRHTARVHRDDDPADDRLEPIEIDADGRVLDPAERAERAAREEPIHVGRELVTAAWQHGRALITGSLPPATDVRRGGSGGPWLPAPAGDGTVAPRARGMLPPTFTRLLDLHPDRLTVLTDWYGTATAGNAPLQVRALTLDAPHIVRAGVWRLHGRLRSPTRARAIPIELLLWAHLGSWTKLRLEPERSIHVGRAYFRSGHRALDRLSDRLHDELGPALS
jgi:hypothetical protein